MNTTQIKRVLLHAGIVFVSTLATGLVALTSVSNVSAGKAVVVSAISAAVASTLHFLHDSLVTKALNTPVPPAPPAA